MAGTNINPKNINNRQVIVICHATPFKIKQSDNKIVSCDINGILACNKVNDLKCKNKVKAGTLIAVYCLVLSCYTVSVGEVVSKLLVQILD